ncbi:MAG: tRNA (adenosine(37)-N6)-threonylcarbamoyltransferase complex ATPase subunit type 1 TsaE [Pseudomonadota bacterium]
MAAPPTIFLPDPEATTRFGAALAPHLCPGDTVLLEGALGAGKTALARAVIQARLRRVDAVEDVPSPSFTLVQTYWADIEIWHCDLYRLTSADALEELGLDEAFDTALVLIEWPRRLGGLLPRRYLQICLTEEPVAELGRAARLDPVGGGWEAALDALAGWVGRRG